MIEDKLTYITESVARLSPENQDRIIIAIEQLLGYEYRNHQMDTGNMKEMFETQPDVY
jgi:hypothetical protein